MTANKGSYMFRNRKGGHEMMTRQTSFKLFLNPHQGFMMLALRAMSVAARTVYLICFSAIPALINSDTRLSGLAIQNAFYHLMMI
jgi:hypothetical protein